MANKENLIGNILNKKNPPCRGSRKRLVYAVLVTVWSIQP